MPRSATASGRRPQRNSRRLRCRKSFRDVELHPSCNSAFLQRDCNLPLVAAGGVNRDRARGALLEACKLLAPLHQHERVVGEQIVQPQRLKLPLAFDAVNVEMIQLDWLALARPSYSCSSVKVGLVTSSGSAASRASAMPFTSVVLPVPRSPVKSRSCGGARSAASFRPTAIVSASLRVVNSCTLPASTVASPVILPPRRLSGSSPWKLPCR